MAARDRMLGRNRGLTFVGAHAASIEWSVERLARFLDAFPKAHVDLAARMAQFQHQSVRDHAAVRGFFIRYQDRILYGTDLTHNPGLDGAEFRASARKRWLSDWQYLATGEDQRIAEIDADARGLALPRSVIDKIYYDNARRVFAPRAPPVMQTVNYQPDDTNFANPERGFSRARRQVPVDPRAIQMSLLHLYFRLDDFEHTPLPAEFLKTFRDRFDEARALGVKAVPRFTYSFPRNEDYSDTDAPLPTVFAHLDQLAPILSENADVIAVMEAGFIGAWGEWHHSTDALETPAAKAAVLRKLLRVLPSSRAVTLRYQGDKQLVFGRSAPMEPAEAFTGTDVARVGHHNDCLLASADNWGAYRPHDAAALAAQKAYLRAESRFLRRAARPATRLATPSRSSSARRSRRTRPPALEPAQFRLPSGGHQAVATPGLSARNRPPPRLSVPLDRRELPGGRRARRDLQRRDRPTNDGFAAPYNELDSTRAEKPGVVARICSPARHRSAPLGCRGDSRHPVAGCLPAAIEPGVYDAFLNLPDPAPRLRGPPNIRSGSRTLACGSPKPATIRSGLRYASRGGRRHVHCPQASLPGEGKPPYDDLQFLPRRTAGGRAVAGPFSRRAGDLRPACADRPLDRQQPRRRADPADGLELGTPSAPTSTRPR